MCKDDEIEFEDKPFVLNVILRMDCWHETTSFLMSKKKSPSLGSRKKWICVGFHWRSLECLYMMFAATITENNIDMKVLPIIKKFSSTLSTFKNGFQTRRLSFYWVYVPLSKVRTCISVLRVFVSCRGIFWCTYSSYKISIYFHLF